MGELRIDAAVAGPPTKKRGAFRQLSKDDSSDGEDEHILNEEGTFQRASNDILASRRIVKVRRTAASVTSPTSNPFAGICLVPPATAEIDSALAASNDENIVPPEQLGPTSAVVLHEHGFVHTRASEGTEVALPQSETMDVVATPLVELGKGIRETQEGNAKAADVRQDAEREEAITDYETGLNKESEGRSITEEGNTVKAKGTEDGEFDDEAEESGPREELNGMSGGKIETKFSETDDKAVDERKEEQKFDDRVENGTEEEEFGHSSGDKSEENGSEQQQQAGEDGTSSTSVSGQPSSTKNFFPGSHGATFSTPPYSFGNSLTSSGFTSFGSSSGFGSGSLFGSKGTNEGGFSPILSELGKANGVTPFGSFGSLANSTTLVSSFGQSSAGLVSLQEVPVKTGEEQEKAVFTADATIFEFLGGGWKERGKGGLKVNVPVESGGRPRLVMRSKGNCRLLLNADLFADMKLASMDSRGVSFACINSATEGKGGLTTYAVRFKDALAATEFRESVDTHKAKPGLNSKTPENFPRASHDIGGEVETSEP